MIQDKSTRFTLFATGILLLALFLISWVLSRAATARRASAAPPIPIVAPVAPEPAAPAGPVQPLPALPLNDEGRPVADYQVLTEVTLLEDPANDGDTFLLKTPEGEHRFCLYFVDTVETDGGQPEAARDMAGYFGFDSEEPLRALGLEAREFSLRLLRASAMRVVTRWEKNPDEDAYLAFIYMKDQERGLINLAQWLVRYGLARIVPCEQDQPNGATAAQFRGQLLEEEALGKSEAVGAWNRKVP
jgi:endonuclease YncB( thermonuclease family)